MPSYPFNILNFGFKQFSRYTLKVNRKGYLSLEVKGASLKGNTKNSKNQWVHVAVTMPSNGTLGNNILYVNGDVYATSSSTQVLDTADNPVYVGGQARDTDGVLGPVLAKVGQIDDLRMFGTALTEAQVEAVMNNNQQSQAKSARKLITEKVTEATKQVKAYPVPTSGLLNISVPNGNAGNLDYQIYSIQGKLVDTGVIKENYAKQTLDISKLNSGVYIINLKDTEGVVYRVKVIKN